MSSVLIIGYGSIGKKHALAFAKEGASVSLCTRNMEPAPYPRHTTLAQALVEAKPSIVVIANVTSDHDKTLRHILDSGFSGKILIEKPLFKKNAGDFRIPETQNCFVTYNLRFHPCIRYLRQKLKDQKVLLATIYCGQYLPTWRPGIDYRQNYSAIREQGGGVLRDLSHELDYASLLFGQFTHLKSAAAKVSQLEINTEDTCSILAEATQCRQLLINLNYLDRNAKRELIVVTDETTYHVDMIGVKIIENKLEVVGLQVVNTYEVQARAALAGDFSEFCTFEQGLEVVRLIERIEMKSAQD